MGCWVRRAEREALARAEKAIEAEIERMVKAEVETRMPEIKAEVQKRLDAGRAALFAEVRVLRSRALGGCNIPNTRTRTRARTHTDARTHTASGLNSALK